MFFSLIINRLNYSICIENRNIKLDTLVIKLINGNLYHDSRPFLHILMITISFCDFYEFPISN